jgi:hypothetical protein
MIFIVWAYEFHGDVLSHGFFGVGYEYHPRELLAVVAEVVMVGVVETVVLVELTALAVAFFDPWHRTVELAVYFDLAPHPGLQCVMSMYSTMSAAL